MHTGGYPKVLFRDFLSSWEESLYLPLLPYEEKSRPSFQYCTMTTKWKAKRRKIWRTAAATSNFSRTVQNVLTFPLLIIKIRTSTPSAPNITASSTRWNEKHPSFVRKLSTRKRINYRSLYQFKAGWVVFLFSLLYYAAASICRIWEYRVSNFSSSPCSNERRKSCPFKLFSFDRTRKIADWFLSISNEGRERAGSNLAVLCPKKSISKPSLRERAEQWKSGWRRETVREEKEETFDVIEIPFCNFLLVLLEP